MDVSEVVVIDVTVAVLVVIDVAVTVLEVVVPHITTDSSNPFMQSAKPSQK